MSLQYLIDLMNMVIPLISEIMNFLELINTS